MEPIDSVRSFENRIIAADRKLQYMEGQYFSIKTQLETNTKTVEDSEEKNNIFLKAATLLQKVSEKTREHSIVKIENIVTQAIQEVYGNISLQFKIVFENKRNGVSVEFKLWDCDLNNYLNLVRSEAGGIKNIIATILRLVVIDLCHPRIEGPVVLDEIGVHISEEYQERFGKFLKQYSEMTGRQIILVSHLDKVKEHANQKIRVTRSGLTSSIRYC